MQERSTIWIRLCKEEPGQMVLVCLTCVILGLENIRDLRTILSIRSTLIRW